MLLRDFCRYNFAYSTLTSCGWMSPKAILIFPKIFLDFRSDTIEKPGIISPSNYENKSYASVVLSDSEVTFLGKGEFHILSNSLLCFIYTRLCIVEEVCCQTSLSFILISGGFPSRFLKSSFLTGSF